MGIKGATIAEATSHGTWHVPALKFLSAAAVRSPGSGGVGRDWSRDQHWQRECLQLSNHVLENHEDVDWPDGHDSQRSRQRADLGSDPLRTDSFLKRALLSVACQVRPELQTQGS